MKRSPGQSELLQSTLGHALGFLENLDDTPVAPIATLAELRARLNRELPADPCAAREVIDQLVNDTKGGLTHSQGGRFFAWVIGGTIPAALAADWLTSTWDQNSGMFSVAPAAAVVEEVCGRWLLDVLRLPTEASFALVTGCQMAHVTCLAAARNAVLARHDWDVEQRGLVGAPAIRVLTGDQRHGTIERAVRMLGLGRDCIHDIATDQNGQLRREPLRAALADAPETPTILLLQAGDLNTGSFDPYEELIPLAHEHHAWVHVDGAFGLWAAASPTYQHLTKGVENADSWATDAHKWLNVPYDCGVAIVANRDAHYRAMSHHASYLSHSEEARDQVDWNPEYSRRGRGFATYAAMRSLGRTGITALVDDACRLAKDLVMGASEIPGVEVLHVPHLNQGLLRFPCAADNATTEDHDQHTEVITARIVTSGEAQFACTTWRGMRCMRVSVSGWRTDDADISRTLTAIRGALTFHS